MVLARVADEGVDGLMCGHSPVMPTFGMPVDLNGCMNGTWKKCIWCGWMDGVDEGVDALTSDADLWAAGRLEVLRCLQQPGMQWAGFQIDYTRGTAHTSRASSGQVLKPGQVGRGS